MRAGDGFRERYPFDLDGFQLRAMAALDADRSVLVAAPTGSGKTVVAEYAIERALDGGHKAFYTTPLKALSNQKFGDLVARYGAERVGLLTGDNSINGEAPIVVMTTEVLRNMLYERSATLQGLRVVVMDEVHYLQDPYRGAVWEEVLIHLPASASVVCLSATISNAEEFGEWIESLRGSTEVIIEERRPVPLEQHYMVGRRLHPMYAERDGDLVPNPYLVSLSQSELRVRNHRRRSGRERQDHRRSRARDGHREIRPPTREEVVEALGDADLLPAIYFVFSRAGCDRAVRNTYGAGVRLTTPQEAERIRGFVDMRAAWLGEEDLWALGFENFRDALCAGIASHHAGMLPVFKETVEELFEQNLVKVVFATETLSLGINMPARSVVIEDLWKFQGERHEMLTAGEYTQLTGRAGRRGIDSVGHAVVLHQRDVEFERVAALASTRTYQLRSSFRPSYNMAVNLVRNYTRRQAHELLDSSFAQFLTDRGVVSITRSIDRDLSEIEALRPATHCDRGDFMEYWALQQQARTVVDVARAERDTSRSQAVKEGLAMLRPGDVVRLPSGRRRGLVAVVASRDGKPTVLSVDRRERPFRLLASDLASVPPVVGAVTLPKTGRSHSPKYRREVAAALVALEERLAATAGGVRGGATSVDDPVRAAGKRARELEAQAEAHPCHRCPDRADHERAARSIVRLREQMERSQRRMRSKTETLGRRFDRVISVLEQLGYIEDFTSTDKGLVLAHLYGEADLLIAEALDTGLLSDLEPPDLAAVVSAMVYQSRERFPRPASMPTPKTGAAARELVRMWSRIHRIEGEHQVELCKEPDLGFAETIAAWADGGTLEAVLELSQLTPGDFVRNCKLLLDALRQIAEAAPDLQNARAARTAIERGIVAYTGV